MSMRWPSPKIVVMAVFQDTPRAWATRATVRWWTTMPSERLAHRCARELGTRIGAALMF